MSESVPRPLLVATLLARPLPALRRSGAPWNKAISSRIKELLAHPLLESCLHLMNDDLVESAQLLRKMPPDNGYGTWLSGILSSAEGEYATAKGCFRDVPRQILTCYYSPYPHTPSLTAHLQACHLLDSLGLCLKVSPTQIYADTVKSELSLDSAWTAEELERRIPLDREGAITDRVRRMRWAELGRVLEELERLHGWGGTRRG